VKGVILAGGSGTRLDPLTRVANKHLLPVYDRPMIAFALDLLQSCGITDVVLVTGSADVPAFERLLGDGRGSGLEQLAFAGQERPGGIAQALGLAEPFVQGGPVAVLLGDNIFERSLAPSAARFRASPRGARLVLATVDDPRPYGVAVFDNGRLARVVEKPMDPPSSQIVTGMYFFDAQVFDAVRGLRPSARGELEITDVVNHYLQRGLAEHDVVAGYWIDCGESIAALLRAGNLVAERGANRAN
jgi:glucose-1-phosphate thymidylyltransferase